MISQSLPANGPIQAEKRAARQLVLALLASVCGALITGALNTSPQVTLIGAALGSALPTLVTFAGPYQSLRAGLAIAVTAAALFLTYGGFTAFDFATERAATFPLPSAVPPPVSPPENDVRANGGEGLGGEDDGDVIPGDDDGDGSLGDDGDDGTPGDDDGDGTPGDDGDDGTSDDNDGDGTPGDDGDDGIGGHDLKDLTSERGDSRLEFAP